MDDKVEFLPTQVLREPKIKLRDVDNYDATSDEFKDIAARSQDSDSKCMYGTSFLVFERGTGRLLEFFFGSKSSRPIAGDMAVFLPLSQADIDRKKAGGADVSKMEAHGPLPCTMNAYMLAKIPKSMQKDYVDKAKLMPAKEFKTLAAACVKHFQEAVKQGKMDAFFLIGSSRLRTPYTEQHIHYDSSHRYSAFNLRPKTFSLPICYLQHAGLPSSTGPKTPWLRSSTSRSCGSWPTATSPVEKSTRRASAAITGISSRTAWRSGSFMP